jgi:peptide/nickel transport system substrate-binding protein
MADQLRSATALLHTLTPGGPSRRQVLRWASQIGLLAPAMMVGAEGAAHAQGTPRRGGTLIMVTGGDPTGFNVDITTAITDYLVGSQIYEGMTAIDQDFRPVPWLAKSWAVSDDGTRYTFQLVQAKWSDGQPMTSKDVKFTLEQVSGKYGSKFAAAAARIKNIATPDEATVVIELDRPYGPLLFTLSSYGNAGILPEHVFAGTNVLENPASRTAPVGTGPFMLSEFVRGDHVTLKRNPTYWQEGKPYLDQIIFKVIPNEASRVLALKAGEVDFCHFYYFPTSHVAEAKADPKLQTREHGVPENRVLVLNVRNAPLSNVKVRQALFTAIDREFIRQSVFLGLGSVQKNAIDSRIPWAHDPNVDLSKLYPFDPAQAAKLLDEAGLHAKADGARFELRYVYTIAEPGDEAIGELLTQMWGKIGVKVILQGGTQDFLIKRMFIDWDFDLSPQSFTTGGDPALGVARLYVSSAIRKAPYVNASGYSTPEVDTLFDQGAGGSTPETRGVFYKKAAALLARDVPTFPICETPLMNVASKQVQGRWAWSTGYSWWESVWVET